MQFSSFENTAICQDRLGTDREKRQLERETAAFNLFLSGSLPSGARFLVSNASPKPKTKSTDDDSYADDDHEQQPVRRVLQQQEQHLRESRRRRRAPPKPEPKKPAKNPGRDPLTLAISEDGAVFSKAWAVLSCHEVRKRVFLRCHLYKIK
jgi:hypothetical protein